MSIPETVTIVIPSVGRRTLKKLLMDLGGQIFAADEIVVVDNCRDGQLSSTISSWNLSFDVKVVRESRAGSCYALNTGLLNCQHHWIVIVDDDCSVVKNWRKNLKILLHRLDERVLVMGGSKTTAKDVYSQVYQFFIDRALTIALDKSSNTIAHHSLALPQIQFLDKKNMVFNRSFLDETRFDLQFSSCGEDIDFGMQWLSKGGLIGYWDQWTVDHLPEDKNNFYRYIVESWKHGVGIGRLQVKWQARGSVGKAKKIFGDRFRLSQSGGFMPSLKSILTGIEEFDYVFSWLVILRFGLYQVGSFYARTIEVHFKSSLLTRS